MRKIIILIILSMLSSCSFAFDEERAKENNAIQSRIDKIGVNILNANRINKRIIFIYGEDEKETFLKNNQTLTKRQVIVYGEKYKNIETDDELAGYLAREIYTASRSYDGIAAGWLSSVKIKAAPKKYELVFDKLAVDAMVKAGYNPLGLIVFINKTSPQRRQDLISNKNLTSKRLAYIYERIYFLYPSFLKDNKYIENEYYQNFLLTSQDNRRMIEEKAKAKDYKRELKYE